MRRRRNTCRGRTSRIRRWRMRGKRKSKMTQRRGAREDEAHPPALVRRLGAAWARKQDKILGQPPSSLHTPLPTLPKERFPPSFPALSTYQTRGHRWLSAWLINNSYTQAPGAAGEASPPGHRLAACSASGCPPGRLSSPWGGALPSPFLEGSPWLPSAREAARLSSAGGQEKTRTMGLQTHQHPGN